MEFIENVQRLKAMQAAKPLTFDKGTPHGFDPKLVAEAVLTPVNGAAQAAAAIAGLNLSENLNALVKEFEVQLASLKAGNNSQIEDILYTQSVLLNLAFIHFLQKLEGATSNATLLAQKPELIACLAELALKCQDRSRRTLATLSEIRTPKKPAQFIKNYVDKQLNQLRVDESLHLKEQDNAPVDLGSSAEAEPSDTKLETLGTQYGAEKRRRKAKGSSKLVEKRASGREL